MFIALLNADINGTLSRTKVKYVMAMLLLIISINVNVQYKRKMKTLPKHEYDIQYTTLFGYIQDSEKTEWK